MVDEAVPHTIRTCMQCLSSLWSIPVVTRSLHSLHCNHRDMPCPCPYTSLVCVTKNSSLPSPRGTGLWSPLWGRSVCCVCLSSTETASGCPPPRGSEVQREVLLHLFSWHETIACEWVSNDFLKCEAVVRTVPWLRLPWYVVVVAMVVRMLISFPSDATTCVSEKSNVRFPKSQFEIKGDFMSNVLGIAVATAAKRPSGVNSRWTLLYCIVWGWPSGVGHATCACLQVLPW